MTVLIDHSQRTRVLGVVRNDATDLGAKSLVESVRSPKFVCCLRFFHTDQSWIVDARNLRDILRRGVRLSFGADSEYVGDE